MEVLKTNSKYYIYILECENNALYTGVTTDYKRRFDEHSGANNSKKGAKFTKVNKPKEIVALWKTDTRSNAQKLESRIKQLDKKDKMSLIEDNRLFKVYFKELIDLKKYRRVKISR